MSDSYRIPGKHYINGIPMIEHCPKDHVLGLESMSLHDEDMFITGYPKSGKQLIS